MHFLMPGPGGGNDIFQLRILRFPAQFVLSFIGTSDELWRIPCATFAARMGIKGWVKTFAAEARSGAYLAVVTSGEVRPGDEVRVVSRPGHDVDVPTTFRAFMGELEAAERVLAVGCLPEHELAALRDMVQRRRAKGA